MVVLGCFSKVALRGRTRTSRVRSKPTFQLLDELVPLGEFLSYLGEFLSYLGEFLSYLGEFFLFLGNPFP